MTYPISDVTRRVVYSGSAGTGPYGFSFEILTENDIGVYKNNLLQTLTTDYTVTINADGTGSITLTSAATADDTIAIYGTKGIARTTDFVTGGDLFANSLNDELDAQTIFAQQNAEAILRSLRAPVTDPTTIDMRLPLKADRAGRVLGFNDTTGNPEVGPLMSKVETLAAVSDDIALLADLQDGTTALSVLSDLADIKEDLDAVGGISSDIQTLAAIAADIQLLADIEDGTDATDAIQTVVDMSADITAVLAIADDISTAADNVTDITNFADVYIGPAISDPTTRSDGSALQAGDLYFNTLSSTLKTYNGSLWVSSGGITDVVLDTTPQLGGDLDVNGHKIVSTSGNDIILEAPFGDNISFVVNSDEKMSIGASRVNVYDNLYNHTTMYFTTTSYPEIIGSSWWRMGRQASVLQEVYYCVTDGDFKSVYGNLGGSADTILMTGTGGQVKIGTRNPSTGADTTYLTVDSNGLTIDNTNKININDNLEIYDIAGTEYIETIVGNLNLLVKNDFSIYDNNRAFAYFFYDNSTQKLYLHANQYSDQIVINTTDITFQDTFIANDTSTFNDTVTVNSTVYVGTGSIDASAVTQIDSTTQGFLPPRMTDTQRNAITSPATGLMIYNTSTNKINFYNGSAWRAIDDSAV